MKTKKALLLGLCALLLVAASVMGTLAYLTAQDSVTNTFTVGSVDITLDEADVNELGEAKYYVNVGDQEVLVRKVTFGTGWRCDDDTICQAYTDYFDPNSGMLNEGVETPTAKRDKANEYHLLPGHTYVKDPTVHVDKKSEDCYVFVVVDNQIAGIEDQSSTIESQMSNSWIKTNWQRPEGASENAVVYVYDTTPNTGADGEATVGGVNLVVFENFKIAGNVDNKTLATYADKTIVVTAYAVQADGFVGGSGAQGAWNATFGAQTATE